MKNKGKRIGAIALVTALCGGAIVNPSAFYAMESNNKTTESKSAMNTTLAEGDIAINEKNFPDATFRGIVTGAVDDNGDGILSKAEREDVVIFRLHDYYKDTLESLEGIGFFPNLLSLECSGLEKLTTIDTSNNPSLKELHLFQMNISTLHIENNKELEFLSCEQTKIKNLDISNNTALEQLYCIDTPIDSINVENNTKLWNFRCKNTDVTSIDVTHNPELKTLICTNLNISEINLKNNPKLEELGIANDKTEKCKVTEIDTSNNPNLREFYCPELKIKSLDLRNNPELMRLEISKTLIKSINISQNKKLNVMFLLDTPINSLDASAQQDWRLIDYSNTPLAWLNIGNVNDMAVIRGTDSIINLNVEEGSFNITKKFPGINPQKMKIVEGASWKNQATGELTGYREGKPIIYSYNCGTMQDGSEITLKATLNLTFKDPDLEINEATFPDKTFRNIVATKFDTDLDDVLTPAELSKVTTISLNDASSTSISTLEGIEYFSELTSLVCNNTAVKELDLSKNTKLETLDCSNNPITTLDISHNLALTDLICNSTKIGNLDVSNHSKLTTLECQDTPLAWLHIGDKPNLDLTYSENTTVEIEEIGKTFNMQEKLPGIDLQKISNVQNGTLDKKTGIVTVNDAKQPITYTYDCGTAKSGSKKLNVSVSLKDITINDSNFTNETFKNKVINEYDTNHDGKISIDEAAQVKKITFNGDSSVTDLKGIEYFTSLTELSCEDTSITSLDISKNSKLEELNCAGTKIPSLDVTNNKELKKINCEGTSITSLDVSKSSKLEELNCAGTKISALDVTNNKELKKINCEGATITSLDVSKNTKLTELVCENCPLAWLEIGDNGNITNLKKSDSVISIKITEDNFTIEKVFAGINPKKVKIKSGGTIDSKTGIISGYTAGVPIVYTYDCGSTKDGKQELEVHLTLTGVKGNSSITITENLNKSYDGNAVHVTPNVSKTGSMGAVSYIWQKQADNNTWQTITKAPKEVGKYRVIAKVAADENFKEATSEAVTFTITPQSIEGNKKITVSKITSDKDLENLIVKDGEKVLSKGTDYEVSKTEQGKIITVTITFKGNYTGVITKSYENASDGNDFNGGTDGSNGSNGGSDINGGSNGSNEGTSGNQAQPVDTKKNTIQTGDATEVAMFVTGALLTILAVIALKSKKVKE